VYFSLQRPPQDLKDKDSELFMDVLSKAEVTPVFVPEFALIMGTQVQLCSFFDDYGFGKKHLHIVDDWTYVIIGFEISKGEATVFLKPLN
jgi:hypothetical protein